MADAALAGQRALPGVPLAHGYHFRYPEIDIAFRDLRRLTRIPRSLIAHPRIANPESLILDR